MRVLIFIFLFGSGALFASDFCPTKQQEELRNRLVGNWASESKASVTAEWQTIAEMREEAKRKIAEAQKVQAERENNRRQSTARKVLSTERGIASYYYGHWIGRKTANGEIYKANDITAAHKTLPFNTMVKATNLKNGKSVIVRINNRGPFVKGRIIDLSLEAARKIDMTRCGIVPIKLEILGRKQT